MSTLPNIQPAWFDSHGYLLGTLPEDCISDCSHAGACDADVEYWRGRLDFTVPREQAIGYTPVEAGRMDGLRSWQAGQMRNWRS